MKRADRNRPHSRIYRKLWEDFNNACLLSGIHVHHIDGNPFNNTKENLLACTAEEHWRLHYNAGDSVAINGKFIQYASHAKENHYRWGKSVNTETKQKISNTLKNKYHKKPNTRLKHSREQGGKPILVYKAILSSHYPKKTYIKGDLIAQFDTQIDACEQLNLQKSKVCLCLHKKRPMHKDYIFEFKGSI
jgi:hypothetical protein